MATLTLYNGDCLEVMKEIPDASVDLIICDLPYGCLEPNRKSKTTDEEIKEYGKGRMEANRGGCAWDVKINLQSILGASQASSEGRAYARIDVL